MKDREIARGAEILDLLRKGIQSHDVLEMIEGDKLQSGKPDGTIVRANESGQNIMNAISQVPGVVSTKLEPWRQHKDKGNNVIVRLDSKLFPVPEVKVHCNSSINGINTFKKGVEKKYDLRPGEADAWLFSHRRMVINGNLLPGEIRRWFLIQLDDIKAFEESRPRLRRI